MARRDLRTDINFIERFGWLYLDYEAHVFFYGLLCIVRRALFMVLSRIPDTLWQSAIAIVLIVCVHAFHLKLEPYLPCSHLGLVPLTPIPALAHSRLGPLRLV